MTDPRTYLQDVLAKAGAATSGPWIVRDEFARPPHDFLATGPDTLMGWHIIDVLGGHENDAVHIASSRTSVPTLARALLAVWGHLEDARAHGRGVNAQDVRDIITTELAKEIEHG